MIDRHPQTARPWASANCGSSWVADIGSSRRSSPSLKATPATWDSTLLVALYAISARFGSPHAITAPRRTTTPPAPLPVQQGPEDASVGDVGHLGGEVGAMSSTPGTGRAACSRTASAGFLICGVYVLVAGLFECSGAGAGRWCYGHGQAVMRTSGQWCIGSRGPARRPGMR
jgi:hypothetical protein